MKILLLRPYYGANICGDMSGDFGIYDYFDHVFPDLHMLYAASLIHSLNVDLKVIDANAEKILPDLVVEQIDASFDTILLKAQLSTVKLDIEFAQCLKKLFPQSEVILIGNTANILQEWIQNHTPEIIVAPIKNIEDFVYYLITSKKRHLTLDELPTPNYHLFPYQKYYNGRGQLRASIYTSRGCLTHCGYCPYMVYFDGMYEERSLEKLSQDIEYLLSMGYKNLAFRDQNFSTKKERILAFCKMIKEKNYQFQWEVDTRIDLLDERTLDAMVEAGVELVSFGVETASEEVFHKYHRPSTKFAKYREVVEYLDKKGVKTLSFYIIGFPNDNWENIKLTYKLAEELGTSYANFNVWNPFVGTTGWEEYKQYNHNTPDLYALFKRRMNFVVPNRLEVDKLDFMARYLNYRYIEHKQGFEFVYNDYQYEEMEMQRQKEGYEQTQTFFEKVLNERRVCQLVEL